MHCRRRHRDDEKNLAPTIDPELMSAEERSLYEAQRIADEKAQRTGEALKFLLIAITLLVFVWPIGVAALVIWGPRHLRFLYRLVVEPRLRERFLEEEIAKQVHEHISEERRALENEHARSLEELSARVAHEIRNPITAAKSLVQQMEEDPEAPENVEYARVAMAELSRVERSVSHLLRFARDEEMRVGTVRMADVVDSALETFRDRFARTGIEVERELATEGRVEGDAEQLRRAVINLVGNAVDAASEADAPPGRIGIHLGENLAGTGVWLRISDNGPGLDEEAKAKMWSPFYTNKPGGTGLGLAITRKLVESHGGEIEASPGASGGAEFVLTLPKQRTGRGERVGASA